MIARIVIPIILVVLLTDWYVDRRFIRMCRLHRKALRCCWWLQITLVVVYSSVKELCSRQLRPVELVSVAAYCMDTPQVGICRMLSSWMGTLCVP